jgi:ATP-binding cassette, subfamily B, bacterial
VHTLAETSPALTVALGLETLASATLPNGVLVALGVLVGRIPAAIEGGVGSPAYDSALRVFAVLAAAFVGALFVAPLHEALAGAIRVRLTMAMQGRVMAACAAPVTVAHLEDPMTLDRIALAQGALSSFFPADAPATLSKVVSNRLTGLLACAVIGVSASWPLALFLAVLWPLARRPILAVIERHVAAFGGNADVMRRALYFQQLATKPSASKELRLFGLGPWTVERFRRHWLDGMAEAWRIRARLYATVLRVGTVVLFAYVGSAAYLAWLAWERHLSLQSVAIAVPILAITMSGGSVSFDDLSLEWMLAAFPQLGSLEAELGPAPTAHSAAGSSAAPAVVDRIRFEGVSFRYPGAGEDTFRDLDLNILAGRSTAIVGPNGAGKTTVVKLLTRLHDPTCGRIEVDGVDLATTDADEWRRRSAVVFQDFVRYPVTAAENVAFGAIERSGDREGVVSAARRAGVADAIEALPRGWETTLSRQFEDGVDLSGGQWQRIAMARALFAAQGGAPILVLDEPTAWLDARGEAEFFERFLELTRGLTTIVVSHRFSTVRLADHICVLEGGRLTEQGTHDELVAQGGTYARMFRTQAARFEEPSEAVAE